MSGGVTLLGSLAIWAAFFAAMDWRVNVRSESFLIRTGSFAAFVLAFTACTVLVGRLLGALP